MGTRSVDGKKFLESNASPILGNNSLSNSNFNVKKIIIGHICYSKQNFVPSPHHTQNLV